MRSTFALLFVLSLGAGLAPSRAARAQPSPADVPSRDEAPLRVAREEGAEGCPDTAELADHVARLRGRPTTRAPVAYQVTFSHLSGVYRAAIRMGGGGVRVLKDQGASCASLEQATALTLALLLDSDAHELTVEEHAPAPAPTAAAPRRDEPLPRPLRPPPRPERAGVALALSFGGAGLFGVVQTAAPAALADVGLLVSRFRTSVGALWMPTQKLDFAPGLLRESLLSGVARTCYAPFDRRPLRLEVCTGVYAGLLRVEARGYTRNDVVERAWLAVPVELALATAASPIGVELGATALLPLRQSDFSIDNVGTAYESWPVGLLLSLRAVGGWVP